MTAGFLVIGWIRPLEPVLEIRNESLLLKDTFSLAEIEPTIIQAAERRRWKIEKLGPGRIKGKLNSRNRFDLTVETTFTTTVSIRYLDSRQLRFDGSDIHWKANRWMRIYDHLSSGVVEAQCVGLRATESKGINGGTFSFFERKK